MKVLKAGLMVTTLAMLLVAAPNASHAQATKSVMCKDGSNSKAGRGACSGHGGVADTVSTKAAPAKVAPAPAAGAGGTAAATKAAPAPTKSAAAVSAAAPPSKAAAAGGGAGKVWVNTKSGVYHMEGDEWYGKTKAGKYMTEADAIKAGYRAEKGNASKKP